MIKAGSLLYAIFICLIISSIASSFALYSYYKRIYLLQYEARNQALSRMNSAIALIRANDMTEPIDETLFIFEDDKYPISVKAQDWGLYYLATVKTTFKKDSFYLNALLGYRNKNSFALYLTNSGEALSLSGDARLKGEVYISKYGIKRAYIEGNYYSGSKLVYGPIKESNFQLPSLRTSKIEYIREHLRKGDSEYIEKQISIDSQKSGTTISVDQSFAKLTAGYYSPEPIELLKGNLTGRIIIKSDDEIFIGAEMNLQHVVLIAPKIKIQDGFKGKINIIASDTVMIGKNCELQYPSSIMFFNNDFNSYLEIENEAKVVGEIVLYNKSLQNTLGLICIKEGAEVIGNIFSSSSVELKGKIIGSLTANQFIVKTPSSMYANYLMDGVIDRNAFPNEYIGSGCIPLWSHPTKEIIEWLK